MRSTGQCHQMDLRSDGGKTATLTPGSTVVSAEFRFQAAQTAINNKWPLVESIGFCLLDTLDQAASGGSVVNDDDLPRLVDSIDINGGILGNTHPRQAMPGPVLFHVWEWLANGYQRTDFVRNQVAAADGDSTVRKYGIIPYTSELFASPHHFAPYLGWLLGQKITFYLAASNALDSVSTGMVSKATTTVRMWANTFVSSRLFVPSVLEYRVFDQPAANQVICDNIGLENKWNGLRPGARIAALYELTNQKGLGGPAGADNITAVKIPALGLDTEAIDAFFINYRTLIGGHRDANSGLSTTIVNDEGGNPEALSATGHSSANELAPNTSTALFTPYKSPGRGQHITKLPKYTGDLSIEHNVTTPYSGANRRRIAGLFVRQFDKAYASGLAVKAGTSGQVKIATLYGTGKPLREGQEDGLPYEVIT